MDTEYLRALIESDKTRKLRNFMLYHFYQNDTEEIKKYQYQYMLGSTIEQINEWVWNGTEGRAVSRFEGVGMFSEETASMMPKFHRDVTNKALNNICTSYHTGIDRYLTNDEGEVQREQTKLLNDIYKNAGVNLLQKEWYKQGKLFNIVEVKPVWRKKTEKVEFDIWQPNFFTVEMDGESYLYKNTVLFDTIAVIDGEEKDVKEVWTDKEHFYLVFKESVQVGYGDAKKLIDVYDKKPVDGNAEMINPYGMIPSCELRFKIGQDYYGNGMFDLVEDNIWHDVVENAAVLNLMFKGSGGILYSVNMGNVGSIAVQPFTINAVNNVSKDVIEPKIESVNLNYSVAEMIEHTKNNIQQILMMKGLSSQAGTVDNQNAPGVSKALDMDELEMQKQEDEQILVDFEERLYQVVKAVYNYHTTDKKLPDDLTFVCQFNKKKTALNTQDYINKWTFELDRGLKSKVDYLTEDNPSLTEDQAIAQLKKIEEEKANERTDITNNNGTGKPVAGEQRNGNTGNNEN